MVGIDVSDGTDLGEVAPHGHHAQVLRREFDLRVIRI
jgi:hypothetical protein